MEIQKSANFWIRFLARLLDSILIGAIIVLIAFSNLEKEPKWHFSSEEAWFFYVWIASSVVVILGYFIGIPMLIGSTLFQFVLRIKIEFNDSKFKTLIKREIYFSLMWSILFILVGAVINHTLINKYATSDQDSVSYSTLESLRVAIVSTFGTMSVVVQLGVSVSILVRKQKGGFHDSSSNSRVVWINKTIKVSKQDKTIGFRPKLIVNKHYEWIGE